MANCFENSPGVKNVIPPSRSTGKYILLDDAEEEKLRLEMEEKIRQYKAFREAVLQDRENDRIARNLEKEKQLQEYEEMQVNDLFFLPLSIKQRKDLN